MKYSLQAVSDSARYGILSTSRSEIPTPVFMPVGTRGTVKTLSNEELEIFGARLILGNAYHLYLRPGHELIRRLGGLHDFIGWKESILTDSGGYQVFSLKTLNNIDDRGVSFQSHIDGSRHRFTPEGVVEIQASMGSDIIMPLDVCTPYPSDEKQSYADMKRTIAWADDSFRRFHELELGSKGQVLFAIAQGSVYVEHRISCLESLMKLNPYGIAIGGLSVGEPKEERRKILESVIPLLPDDRPRYLMGVGTPEDIIEAVGLGIDMFDCVMPTRNARNGTLFTRFGKMTVKAARYAEDQNPVDSECQCPACRRYSRAFIRHLLSVGEILGLRLASLHNIYFYLNMMEKIRESIRKDSFGEFSSSFLSDLAKGPDALPE